MIRIRLALLCAVLLGPGVQPALANTSALLRSGVWEAFGGTTTSGRPVCGVSSDVDSQYLGIKYFSGDNTITIQLGSSRWSVTDGEKYKLQMQFGSNKGWQATATGMHFNDGDAGLEFSIKLGENDEFIGEFRDSDVVNLWFPDGGFAAWRMGLAGSGATGGRFLECVRKLGGSLD